jgi:hypothetical protein
MVRKHLTQKKQKTWEEIEKTELWEERERCKGLVAT